MVDEKGPRKRAFFYGPIFCGPIEQKRGKSGTAVDVVA
jgi:hypothetical protein